MSLTFPEHLYERTAKALAAIPDNEAHDTYAVSMLVYDEDDDPRRPTVTIGYNTESQVRHSLVTDRPADEAEARWNYAFWLQNELAVIASSTRDPDGVRLRDAWNQDNRLWFTNSDETERGWEFVETIADKITQRFVSTCVQTARLLHNHGHIQKTFGRPIPVLVHELEYYNAIADQAEAANPPGLAADFIAWVRAQ